MKTMPNSSFKKKKGIIFQTKTNLVIDNFIKRFNQDVSKKGLTIIEDIGGVGIPVAELELVSFFKGNEKYVSGKTIFQRSQKLGINLGQNQVEYLLDNQKEIPNNWRKYYLVFPKTIWKDRSSMLYFLFLYWDSKSWRVNFKWFLHAWPSNTRLLRRK